MATEPTATFTLTAAQKIAEAIHGLDNTPTDNTGSRSARKSYNERGFWANLTDYCTTDDEDTYSWVEQVRTKAGWEDKPSGRTGTCNAINSLGMPAPVGVVVWMKMDFPYIPPADEDSSDGAPVFTFVYSSGPRGQYEGQIYGDVTTSQAGFFWPSGTPMVS
jgi:hypothetical protein